MICALCNQFQARWPLPSRADALEHHGREKRHLIVPEFAWSDLLRSARSCYGCDILVSGCRGCFEIHAVDESDILQGSIHFLYPDHDEEVDTADTDKHIAFQLRDGRRFEVELFLTDDDDCPIPDAWDYFPTSNRTSPRTDSELALETVKGWIADCADNDGPPDGLCDVPESPDLPSRVVDVGLEDGLVKLVETNGAKAKYICLSHCWGLEQIIITTTATYDERKKGIAWEELSKTFQDAITMTRTLGFDYIWIDSLCIIQDSVRDWQIESARMASVYSNGHLTLAATHSSNGRGGLFTRTADFCVSGQTPADEAYCLFFRERIDHQVDANNDAAGFTPSSTYFPLLSRAWVYQERMLSTRVLHFGRYELFFECKASVACECGAIEFHGTGTESAVPLIKLEYADALAAYGLVSKGHALLHVRYQGARLWRTMVCCYTALLLTKSSDRLPAIGGLARQMAARRKARYLAGLWEDSLPDDLLWMVYASPGQKRARPYPRNAPTWSWASIETLVDYWNVIIFTNIDESVREVRPPLQHFSTIESCEVTASAVDEFGAIAHGALRVTGLLAEGILAREMETQVGEERVEHYVRVGETRLLINSDYLFDAEGPGYMAPGTAVFCLRMSMLQEGDKDALISLVLRAALDSPDTFERIGSLRIKGAIGSVDLVGDLFQGAETRTVKIV